MPKTHVVIFRNVAGESPLIDWLDGLEELARAKCLIRVERLAAEGHALRRPEADFLRDGVHELRAKHRGINYRILYFFHGRHVAVLSHGFSKQRSTVPDREIDLAVTHKKAFASDPAGHTHEESE